MDCDAGIKLKWHGAAHYHIDYAGLKILIDPLYSRRPGDKPHLELTRDDVDRIDYLLLTHGHLDHSRDFPYLALAHEAEIYAPGECLADVRKEAARTGAEFAERRYHRLERDKGKSFTIADIEVTPYQIGTEDVDLWFLRSMIVRPLLHGKLGAYPDFFRMLSHHLYGNCFAFHFRFPTPALSMLYFGNLTSSVEEISALEAVDVLVLPYCPANDDWLRDSAYLIERFSPRITVVHHFDNFANPFTDSRYMDLGDYRNAMAATCPNAKLYFSKFLREVELSEIAAAA
jgi:hypothetical protein